MKINIIAACDAKGLIGVNGGIPWYIPEDLQRFKKLTTGHAVIMGRKTWESLPVKPLPNRSNIVVTSGSIDTVATSINLEGALWIAKEPFGREQAFIIGGSRLYEEALPIADSVYLTRVKGDYKCDPESGDETAYFPLHKMQLSDWELEDVEMFSSHRFETWRRANG